jgi:hypothetical protein
MKRIFAWAFPAGVIAAWMVASIYTAASLQAMDREWQGQRATVSATPQRA